MWKLPATLNLCWAQWVSPPIFSPVDRERWKSHSLCMMPLFFWKQVEVLKAGGGNKHIDFILMGFVSLSCPGYLENPHECVLCYCRSGRGRLWGQCSIAFSRHPAPPAETAPLAFQFLTEAVEFEGPHLSDISAIIAVLTKLCPAPDTFRCYASDCYVQDMR